MALYKAIDILKLADSKHTAALAFNCADYNMVHSVAVAAETVQKPVICMLHPDHHRIENWITPELFAKLVADEAAAVSVPMAMHLDHCSDFDYLVRALKAGFTSVMYDGSMLPFEENVKNTREITKVAHAMGATVEAELGHVGIAATVTDQSNLDLYTQPEFAAEFCERTSCDSVAVAIGSAHGFYKQTPHLDLERLAAIDAATSTPLVLHGGTGIPDEQLLLAFQRGINKLNVGTEFFWLYYQTVKSYDAPDITQLPRTVQAALTEYLKKKFQLSF